jgi:hypothetical protein
MKQKIGKEILIFGRSGVQHTTASGVQHTNGVPHLLEYNSGIRNHPIPVSFPVDYSCRLIKLRPTYFESGPLEQPKVT